MKQTREMRRFLSWLAIVVCLLGSLAFAADPPPKRSKSDRDINAIGHRRLFDQKAIWYTVAREQEVGDKTSAAYEQSTPLVLDAAAIGYVDGVLQRLAKNSDAEMPVSVHIVNRDDMEAFTIAGGHLYLTRGLILHLQNEGELASVLARGVAHTALRSSVRLQTGAMLLKLSDIPFLYIGQNGPNIPPASLGNANARLAILKFQRAEELDADYFGVQYLYKSGYDTGCFLSTIQATAPVDTPGSALLSPLPPLSDRIEALQKEISEILPRQAGSIVSTLAFTEFQEHLRAMAPPKPPETDSPKLLRQVPAQ